MIEIQNLTKSFETRDGTVEALKNLSVTVADGDIFGIVGASGAGKSTLVKCINLMERPDSGSIRNDVTDVTQHCEKELRTVRRRISMVFQNYNLLLQRNCLENVCYPLRLQHLPKEECIRRARELLALVGLEDKANAYPSQLSGGQQQRIAIARALTTDPSILLCDEPTSALDGATTVSILQLLQKINRELGITILIITHQISVVEQICKHVAILDNGTVAETGEVEEVLARPQSLAMKKLLYPDSLETFQKATNSTQRMLRLVFRGAQTANQPLIAELALQKGIAANILYASTKSVGDKMYGNIYLGLPPQQVADAVAFLQGIPNLTVEEVTEA